MTIIIHMSARANASARARRAGITQPEPTRVQPGPGQGQGQPGPGQQGQGQNGLTLQQVIALVDTRLVTLETFMKETKEQQLSPPGQMPVYSANPIQPSTYSSQDIPIQMDNNSDESVSLDVVLEDFNNRFITLAGEISELKDMLLKLQTFTMDVNKSLYDDRMRILSDLGTQENPTQVFSMSSTDEPVLGDAVETFSLSG